MEFYSAIKKNEMVYFARKWMEEEIIMLNEMSQSHKDKYLSHVLSHLWKLEENKSRHNKPRS
jgi:hypothetical protein